MLCNEVEVFGIRGDDYDPSASSTHSNQDITQQLASLGQVDPVYSQFCQDSTRFKKDSMIWCDKSTDVLKRFQEAGYGLLLSCRAAPGEKLHRNDRAHVATRPVGARFKLFLVFRIAKEVDPDICIEQNFHLRRRGIWSGNTFSISASTGAWRRKALLIWSRIRISLSARVTVSVSVRAPQSFCAWRTSTGSMSQVFLTVGIRMILTFLCIAWNRRNCYLLHLRSSLQCFLRLLRNVGDSIGDWCPREVSCRRWTDRSIARHGGGAANLERRWRGQVAQ